MGKEAEAFFKKVLITLLMFIVVIPNVAEASSLSNITCTDQPNLQSVTPNTVNQGQMNVSLTLIGRDLDKPSVTLDLGQGIEVLGKPLAGTTINDVLKTYTVNINVLNTAQIGRHFINIRYCSGAKTFNTRAFITVNPSQQCTDNPIVTSVNPQPLFQGQMNVKLILAGRELDKPGVRLDFGSGIIVVGMPEKKETEKDSQIYVVTVNVLPTATLGPHYINIQYCNGTKILNTQVVVTVSSKQTVSPQVKPSLTLTSVMPNILEPGKTYQLNMTGTNFSSGMEVQFGEGIKAKGPVKVINTSLAQIEVTVDINATGSRNVEVRPDSTQNWNKTQEYVTILPPKKPTVADVEPNCEPVQVDFTKGILELIEPVTSMGDKEFIQYYGAPLLNDAVVFKWNEKNPGLADYYEFNILTRDGKLLKSIRLNGREIESNGFKIKIPPQTFFHPSAAFIKEILDLLPPLASKALKEPPEKSGVKTGNTKEVKKIQEKNLSSAQKDNYPPETTLLWEVVGFREFKSCCGFTSVNKKFEETDKSFSTKKISINEISLVNEINKKRKCILPPEKVVLEVEHSERWPLSTPERADGLKACSPGGQTKGTLQVQNISDKCVYKFNNQTQKYECQMEIKNGQKVPKIDPNNYPGDNFKLSGDFTIDLSPYAIREEMKDPPPCEPNMSGSPNQTICPNEKIGTGKFLNLVVDWGDGEYDSVVHPVSLKKSCTPKSKGSYGSLEECKYTIKGLEHQYQKVGSYNVRVYMLSDDDMQIVNVNTLAQSVDKNSKNSYLKLAQIISSQGVQRIGSSASPGFLSARSSESDVASRAYVIFCKVVDIRPVEDTDATGPLHLDSINITGFPGHDTGEGTCSILSKTEKETKTSAGSTFTQIKGSIKEQSASLLKSKPSSKMPAVEKSSNIKPLSSMTPPGLRKIKSGGGIDATATTCDDFLTAEGALNYYGQGYVRVSWVRDGIIVRQAEHYVGPSEQRENLDRNPDNWGPPIISTESTIPNSGNLISESTGKSLGSHRVTVNAMVVVKPSSKDIGSYIDKAINNESLGQRMITIFNNHGPEGATFKAGFLSPYKKNIGNAPPVIYGNSVFTQTTGSKSRLKLPLTKPNYVESEPATYAIKESDSKQACTFIFADKDNGEFRISGIQGNVIQKGNTYSGCGTILVPLNNSADGEPEHYPIPIEFMNWSVSDGLHVDKGMKLSVTTNKPVSAPGVTGTLEKVEGTSGDEVKATLSLKLHDTLRLVGGTEKPYEWKNITERLTAKGDWYHKNDKLPETFIGWSAFKIKSDNVTIDLSKSESPGTVNPLCGKGGNEWVGVHLGNASLIPYTFDLVASSGYTPATVNDWTIIDNGICGKTFIDKKYDAKIGEGSVHFDAIDVNSTNGTFKAVYKNMIVHIPWLDTDLKGDAELTYSGGGEKGISFDLKGNTVLKNYANIKMQADKLAFTSEENIGWTVKSDTHFDFFAEGKKFTGFDIPGLFFGFDGRAYFAKGSTRKIIPLGGNTMLGLTGMDLVSVDLDTSKGGNERFKFIINGKIHLSKKIPDADVRVLYSIARTGNDYFGTGPFTGPFEVNVAFPPGQPTVEAKIKPNYTGPSGNSAGHKLHYALLSDGSLTDAIVSDDWELKKQYALNIPGSYDIALLGNEDGDRFNGTIDLAMFGGPPIKAEFRLGYKGGEDYWLTRATINLGSSGVPLTPFMSLYAIRGGLGYNFPINAFSSIESLTAVAPDMSGAYMFMAGMRVGDPSKFVYMLDGDFTVKIGEGARMDYRAWLLSTNHEGEAPFNGYFQYAGGNFDGMLSGKIKILGDAVYMEIPPNAATMHFGGGTWLITAGKREGPRLKAHLLIQDVDGYLSIGNEGLKIGGGMTYKLNAGIGQIIGSVDGGLDITPQPHISGYLEGVFSADICAFDVCIGPSLSTGVNMSALPVSVGAHACFEIDLGFYSPEVCGNFGL